MSKSQCGSDPQPVTARETEGVFCNEFDVSDADIDVNGHVNNVVYVQWMQDVAVKHADAFHVSATGDGAGTRVARSHQIQYLKPAFVGERVRARTWIGEVSRVRARRRYQFVRIPDGAVLAKGETDWVYVSAETGRPRAIPDEIRAAFIVVPDDSG